MRITARTRPVLSLTDRDLTDPLKGANLAHLRSAFEDEIRAVWLVVSRIDLRRLSLHRTLKS
jgi:hypothetical protein